MLVIKALAPRAAAVQATLDFCGRLTEWQSAQRDQHLSRTSDSRDPFSPDSLLSVDRAYEENRRNLRAYLRNQGTSECSFSHLIQAASRSDLSKVLPYCCYTKRCMYLSVSFESGSSSCKPDIKEAPTAARAKALSCDFQTTGTFGRSAPDSAEMMQRPLCGRSERPSIVSAKVTFSAPSDEAVGSGRRDSRLLKPESDGLSLTWSASIGASKVAKDARIPAAKLALMRPLPRRPCIRQTIRIPKLNATIPCQYLMRY